MHTHTACTHPQSHRDSLRVCVNLLLHCVNFISHSIRLSPFETNLFLSLLLQFLLFLLLFCLLLLLLLLLQLGNGQIFRRQAFLTYSPMKNSHSLQNKNPKAIRLHTLKCKREKTTHTHTHTHLFTGIHTHTLSNNIKQFGKFYKKGK